MRRDARLESLVPRAPAGGLEELSWDSMTCHFAAPGKWSYDPGYADYMTPDKQHHVSLTTLYEPALCTGTGDWDEQKILEFIKDTAERYSANAHGVMPTQDGIQKHCFLRVQVL